MLTDLEQTLFMAKKWQGELASLFKKKNTPPSPPHNKQTQQYI